MSHFRRFVQWTDEMQTGGLYAGKVVWLLGVLPMFAVKWLGNWWWVPSSVFAAIWFGFLLWRVYVIARTGYAGYFADEMPPYLRGGNEQRKNGK